MEKLPPGPQSAAIRQTMAWVRRPLPFLDDCARRYGPRFTVRFLGGRSRVVLADPEDVKAVFTGSPDVFLTGRGSQNLKAFAGEHSIFVLDGEEHRKHRRLMVPPFRGERMRAYGDLVRDLALRHLERWPVGRPFSLLAAMHAITVRVIFAAIFGVREEARAERLQELSAKIGRGFAPVLLSFIPALQLDLGPLSPWGRFVRTRAELDEIIYDEIARARRGTDGREDILAKLIEESAKTGEPWGDAELRDELLTLLGAGHETTTAALAWTFQWILGTDGVRERALEEVRGVVGRGPVETQHIPKLRYLDAAVQEALRLSPPVIITLRWLAARAAIGGGRELPEGTIVGPCPYLAHRNPAVYPEPERYRPERFLDWRPTPFEFFPFGGGNRLCIGLAFALHEMKVILATVLARADLRLAAPPTHRAKRKGIVLGPENGTPVVLERLLV